MRRRLAIPFVVLALAAALPLPARADEVAAPESAAWAVKFEPGTPPFADVLAKAKAEGRPVFLDFTTEWCGWCRKLEKDTYTQAAVGEVMKGFVNVMVDAEKGEGPDLAKRYRVSGFPTLVIVDATGAEIDRIGGYRPPGPFTAEVKRILAGEGTLPALRKLHLEAPDDVGAGLAYGVRLAQSDPSAAEELFRSLRAAAAKSGDRAVEARVRLEHGAALLATGGAELAMAAAETLVGEFADTPAAASAGARLGGAFVRAGTNRALAFLDAARGLAKEPADKAEIERFTMAVHRNAMAASLRRQAEAAGDDAQALNEVAWTCFEMKLNVREAAGWARTAVEKSGRDPAILDTLANLLWITGARADAVALETEAESKAEGAMKREFTALISKWKAELDAEAAEKAAK